VPELARPPALPSRPAPTLRSFSGHLPALRDYAGRHSNLQDGRKASNTPSPEKKIRMRSTLRAERKGRISSSSKANTLTSPLRPPAAAKAATQAWPSALTGEPAQVGGSRDAVDAFYRFSISDIPTHRAADINSPHIIQDRVHNDKDRLDFDAGSWRIYARSYFLCRWAAHTTYSRSISFRTIVRW
jgi:hypothetical protein